VSYARTLAGFTAGAEVIAGRDTFGDSFGRLAGFVRFGEDIVYRNNLWTHLCGALQMRLLAHSRDFLTPAW
jgi:hypothetical protein